MVRLSARVWRRRWCGSIPLTSPPLPIPPMIHTHTHIHTKYTHTLTHTHTQKIAGVDVERARAVLEANGKLDLNDDQLRKVDLALLEPFEASERSRRLKHAGTHSKKTKLLSIVPFYSRCTKALTFGSFWNRQCRAGPRGHQPGVLCVLWEPLQDLKVHTCILLLISALRTLGNPSRL